jgi:hypothetical protein
VTGSSGHGSGIQWNIGYQMRRRVVAPTLDVSEAADAFRIDFR